MILKIVRKIKSLLTGKSALPEGDDGIKQLGHRRYVGGQWDVIGQLQFDFLTKNGLLPEHVFLDIACGSLRAGVHLIPYLNKGHYLGIEKEKTLIRLGLEKELADDLAESKSPEFVISDSFEFGKLTKNPDMAIAQSLFTHLPPSLIHACFANLRPQMKNDGVFYATYFLTTKKVDNGDRSHDHDCFYYTDEEVIDFGETNGWQAEIIGEWNHPRDQKMVKYTLR